MVTSVFRSRLTRIPEFLKGGAAVSTAGAVPIGAGTITPAREPGGAGMNTPSGPKAWEAAVDPGACRSMLKCRFGRGARKSTSGADQ
jgi:hypothetical protein